MTVAIIPARGGSKRIPGKNIANIHGKPMLAWPVQSALDSGVFSRVIVSTDCPEISGVARESGAEVPPLRPANISDDLTTLDAVIRYGIAAYDIVDEWVCVLYATAILVRPETLSAAHDLAQGTDPQTSFVMSLVPYPHPIQRAVSLDKGQVSMLNPAHAKTRTQDLTPRYHDAAQFVFGRRKAWMDGRTVWDAPTQGIVLNQQEAIDIDTPGDFATAQALMQYQMSLRTDLSA